LASADEIGVQVKSIRDGLWHVFVIYPLITFGVYFVEMRQVQLRNEMPSQLQQNPLRG